jgi:AmmeMemoRadiSam system protein B
MGVRKPAVAGQFYPGSAQEIEKLVNRYLDEAGEAPDAQKVGVLISPHAGYAYSGRTAGYAFSRIRGAKPNRVILLGCSHRYEIATASVFDSGAFETPLGVFPVDEKFASVLTREFKSETSLPHRNEHCLEVMLPFLWITVGNVPIVPVLFGSPPEKWHENAGRILASLVDEDDLVIASTDLSHFLPDSEAHQIDKTTLDTLLSKNCEDMRQSLAAGVSSMCGASAVIAAMSYANEKGYNEWSLLDYQTSASTSGDYERVVGYAAVSMEREP